MRIILACDKSGGHIFPARCIARFIKSEEIFFFAPSVYFKDTLEKEGFTVYGKVLNFRNIILEGIFRVLEAFILIIKVRPHKVIGFGGRNTFFVVFLSRLFLIETVIYEPNAVMGKANKVLSLFVDKVYIGMPYVGNKKIKCVGIPVRDDLTKCDKENAKRKLGLDITIPVIMCLGGSQGSAFLNRIFRKFIENSTYEFSVIHITGFKQYSDFMEFYGKISRKALVYNFFKDIGILYSATDIIVCRGGALSIAEVVSYRIPAVIVPYPGAGNHQYANARYLEDREACYLVTQRGFSFDKIKSLLEGLLSNKQQMFRIRENLKKLDICIDCKEFYKNFI